MEKEKHINTYFDLTSCMLCVINHIWEGVFNNSIVNNRQQVNNTIKKLFYDLSYSCIERPCTTRIELGAWYYPH